MTNLCDYGKAVASIVKPPKTGLAPVPEADHKGGMGEFLVVGAATSDVQAISVAPVIAGTSNPVWQSHSAGGVARNVAVTLARLGGRVLFVSRIGADLSGDRLVDELSEHEVRIASISRSRSSPTASYTALLEPNGELYVGFSDMKIIDELTPARVEPLLAAGHDAPIWFIDANLPETTIRYIAASKPPSVTLAADGTSVVKVLRLSGVLDAIDWLFVNAGEAAALAGGTLDSEQAYSRAVRALCNSGVGTAIILMGADGLIAADADQNIRLPALHADPVSVTGGGDALVAGTLIGIDAGLDLQMALRMGLACAAITVECGAGTSDSLNLELVLSRAGIAMSDSGAQAGPRF